MRTPDGGDLAHQAEHPLARRGVEAVGRLVEEQQLRAVGDRLGELGELLHAERVGLELAVARLAEADVEQRLVRPLERRAGAAGPRARPSCARSAPPRGPTRRSRSPACSRGARAPRAARSRCRGRGRAPLPAEGRWKPRRVLSSVVLPAPLGPSRPTTWPESDAVETVEDRSPCQADFSPSSSSERCGHRHPELYAAGRPEFRGAAPGGRASGAASEPPKQRRRGRAGSRTRGPAGRARRAVEKVSPCASP